MMTTPPPWEPDEMKFCERLIRNCWYNTSQDRHDQAIASGYREECTSTCQCKLRLSSSRKRHLNSSREKHLSSSRELHLSSSRELHLSSSRELHLSSTSERCARLSGRLRIDLTEGLSGRLCKGAVQRAARQLKAVPRYLCTKAIGKAVGKALLY